MTHRSTKRSNAAKWRPWGVIWTFALLTSGNKLTLACAFILTNQQTGTSQENGARCIILACTLPMSHITKRVPPSSQEAWNPDWPGPKCEMSRMLNGCFIRSRSQKTLVLPVSLKRELTNNQSIREPINQNRVSRWCTETPLSGVANIP